VFTLVEADSTFHYTKTRTLTSLGAIALLRLHSKAYYAGKRYEVEETQLSHSEDAA
jgi:hypothetical protein